MAHRAVSRSTIAVSTVLAVLLSGGPRIATASPPAPEPNAVAGARAGAQPESAPPDQSIDPAPLTGATRLDADGLFESERRAYALYMEGMAALDDAADHDLAIAKWEEALTVLPDERPYARSRGALALRLVTAHEMRFHRDGQLSDLRRQSALLQGYQQRLPEMFPDDAAARKSRHDHVQVRIDEIASELERFEGDHGTVEDQLDRSLRGEYEARGAETWRTDASDAGWHARPDDPRKHADQATDKEAAPEQLPQEAVDDAGPVKKEGTGLLASGAVVGALGLGGIGVGIAGMVTAAGSNEFDAAQTPSDRRAQIARGNRSNTQAVVGLAAGGALVVVGVVLLAIGAKKRKRSPGTMAVVPTFGGRMVGASLGGRF